MSDICISFSASTFWSFLFLCIIWHYYWYYSFFILFYFVIRLMRAGCCLLLCSWVECQLWQMTAILHTNFKCVRKRAILMIQITYRKCCQINCFLPILFSRNVESLYFPAIWYINILFYSSLFINISESQTDLIT